MLINSIYSLWEDYYRKEIAVSLGKEKNDLLEPVMVTETKAEVLRWFEEGDDISLSQAHVEEIVQRVKSYVVGLSPAS